LQGDNQNPLSKGIDTTVPPHFFTMPASTLELFHEQVRTFNNAGVSYLEAGYLDPARTLFKEALRVLKLENDEEDGPGDNNDCREQHVYLMDERITELLDQLEQCLEQPCQELSAWFNDDARERPFICKRLFRIPLSTLPRAQAQRGSLEEQETCVILLYNKALADHLKNRRSPQVFSLYKIATAVVEEETLPNLAIAIYNNMAVWCLENDTDEERAKQYLQALPSLLVSAGSSLNEGDREGFMSNIMWILTPVSAVGSPAA
jgi:tetratricopeptide (TPR) repeat protein